MENKKEKGFTRSQANAIVRFFESNVLLKKLGNLLSIGQNFRVKKEVKIEDETMDIDYNVNVYPKLDNIKVDLVVNGDESVETSSDKPFTVYVMVGVAGAGKDTWIQQNIPDLPVLSRDLVRAEIGLKGDKTVGTDEQERKVSAIINRRMDKLLEAHQSFVVNNMHLKKKYRNEIKKRVAPYGPKLVYVYVEAPSPEINKDRRKGQIPPEEIDRMYSVLSVPTEDECDELIVWKQTKKSCGMCSRCPRQPRNLVVQCRTYR